MLVRWLNRKKSKLAIELHVDISGYILMSVSYTHLHFLYFCELQSPVSILLYLSYNYFYNTCSL